MYTSRNPIVVVNGDQEIRLDTLAWNVVTRTGLLSGPSANRNEAVEVAGRSGTFFRPGARREEQHLVIEMWVSEDSKEGTPRRGYKHWRENLDTLNQLFDTSTRQIEVREYVEGLPNPDVFLTDHSYRRGFFEVRTVITPEMDGRWYGPYKVEIINNDVFWEDSTEITWISPLGGGAMALHDIDPLQGSTAPIEDALVAVAGPITNPTLKCPETAHTLRYTGSVPAGEEWCVNTRTYQSAKGQSIESDIFAGNDAGTSVVADTVYEGPSAPAMFPLAGNPPQVELTGSGTGSGTNVKIVARRKFH